MGATIGGIKTAGVLNGSFGFWRIMAQCIKEGKERGEKRSQTSEQLTTNN
jgi:hypothetical protein